MQPTNATPWLEYCSEQGGPVQKTLLNSFPFSIGRNDTTDLPIQSTRVSREHAVIVRTGQTYRIRDLDSTNGTQVNGQRIEEATLTDGDIVVIADVEFTFFSGAPQTPRKTVTQVIGFREPDGATQKWQDLLRSLRRLQETALQGGPPVSRRPVIDLKEHTTFGFETVAGDSPAADASDRSVLAAHSRLALRVRAAFQLQAIEASLDTRHRLFLELGDDDLAPGAAEYLLDVLATHTNVERLVLTLPDTAVNEIAYFQNLYGRAKDRGVRLCYTDFAGGKPQFEVHRKLPPDFVKLSRSLVRGVQHDRARMGQLQVMLAACQRSGCAVIAPDVNAELSAEWLIALGCRYAIGEPIAVSSGANKVDVFTAAVEELMASAG
jgi:EAL domain-containing protein (putative c-di-GMP-specific phosphodiesterase class I)